MKFDGVQEVLANLFPYCGARPNLVNPKLNLQPDLDL